MIVSVSQRAVRPAPPSIAETSGRTPPSWRIARFSAVGAIGFVFQLGLAWALVGVWRVEPTWAWVASTEATVVHNFVWHVRWTWADRPASACQTIVRLARFNLSNGAISIVGGAIVMRVLTADLGVHFLMSLVASVAVCAMGNLLAGECWAFRTAIPPGAGRPRRQGRREEPERGGPGPARAPARSWRHVVCLTAALFTTPALVRPAVAAAADDLRKTRQLAFDEYMTRSDAAARERVSGAQSFLWVDDKIARRTLARSGALVIEPTNREPATEVPGGLVHDWIGAVFIQGATVEQVIRLVQDYDRHKVVYAPEVIDSRLISRQDQHFVAFMRFRREKIITVILDTVHDAHYARLDDTRWHSRSVTTSVREVAHAGEPGEGRLGPDEGHGFMLNLNTFWRFAQRDGGVYVECQAVSLSRNIPRGLGWILRSIVYSLPRESLTHTLTATRAGVAAASAAVRR